MLRKIRRKEREKCQFVTMTIRGAWVSVEVSGGGPPERSPVRRNVVTETGMPLRPRPLDVGCPWWLWAMAGSRSIGLFLDRKSYFQQPVDRFKNVSRA